MKKIRKKEKLRKPINKFGLKLFQIYPFS
jgi:hypothetical protein